MKPTRTKLLLWIFLLLAGRPLDLSAQRALSEGSYVSVRAGAEQIPLLGRTIAVDLEGASLQQALAQIATHAGLRLTYSTDLLPEDYRLSLRVPRITAAEALLRVLQGTTLDLLVASSGEAVLVRCSPATCGVGVDGTREILLSRKRIGTRRAALQRQLPRLAARGTLRSPP